MNLKYILGALVALPLLPVMYFQGKRVRKSVPKLPEAKEPNGVVKNGDRTLNMLAIGESTIAGVGVTTHAEGFTGTLAKALAKQLHQSIEWKVYAKSGYTAKMVNEKLLHFIKEDNVDLIVIGLGGNNAFTLGTPKAWRRDINNLIGLLQNKYKEAPIVFINMPPIKSFPAFTSLIRFILGNLVEILGQELSKVVRNYQNVYYYSRVITLQDWIKRLKLNAHPDDFFSDGVHPSKLTYQVWAKDVATYITDNQVIE